ncbi:MAG: hypothetical protein Q9222_003156 [Ikaeria aurantiellina]
MSAALGKMVVNKVAKDHGTKYFKPSKDPYFTTLPNGKLSSKKRKDVPPGISPADAKILLSVRRRAYRLDNSISILGMRFGVSSLVGLIPALGDFIDIFLAFMLYLTCRKCGLDSKTKRKMEFNILLDFVLGLTPLLGDVADAFFKANTRNLVELERFLVKKGQGLVVDGKVVGSNETSNESTPVRPGRTEMVEYRPEPPPRYESQDGRAHHNGSMRDDGRTHHNGSMRGEGRAHQAHPMRDDHRPHHPDPRNHSPARAPTGQSSRSGRSYFGGRREREWDAERGEELPLPPQPARTHPRGRNEL